MADPTLMHGPPKFKFLTGDVNFITYGGKWISRRFNNGEFDFWYVLELINWEEAVGEREAAEIGKTYNMSLSVVAPEQFEDKKGVCETFGLEQPWKELTPEVKVEIVHGHSGGAKIWDVNGSNFKKLWKEAIHQTKMNLSFTFGFSMDKPMNKIGTTGWDILKGDVLAGLRRYEKSKATDDPNKNLMLTLQKGGKDGEDRGTSPTPDGIPGQSDGGKLAEPGSTPAI